MNAPEDNDQALALLRDLPMEVSLEQVTRMVAAFPLAVGATGWLASLKTNLNTILIMTIGSLIIATATYFAAAGASDAQITPDTRTPGIQALAPVGEAPQLPSTQPAGLPVLSVADTARVQVKAEAAIKEPTPPPPPAPIGKVAVPPIAPRAPLAPPPPTPSRATALPTSSANAKTYDVRDFSALAAFSSADISVEEGPWSVTASGDPAQVERLVIEVENGVLKVKMKNDKRIRFKDQGSLKVDVRMPQVTRIEQYASGNIHIGEFSGAKSLALTVMGSGDIDLKSMKALEEFSLTVQGSGDINCRSAVVSGRTTVTVMGSGDVKASGSSGNIEVLIQGSGDVDISGLMAQSGKVSILGSGDASVNCTGKLERLVQGSGTINNTGSAGGTGSRGIENNGE